MGWGWGHMRAGRNASVAAGTHGGVQDACEGVGTCADGQVGNGMGRWHAWKVAHREWGGMVVVVGEGGHVTGVKL